MKFQFKDHKSKRHVNETMTSLLISIKQYMNEDVKDCIDITLRCLRDCEIGDTDTD